MNQVSKIAASLALCFLLANCGSDGSAASAVASLISFTPLTSTTLSVSEDDTATVQYLVTSESAEALTLEMEPITGITQLTSGVGVCANPIELLNAGDSCTLSLEIDGSQLPDSVSGGPTLCRQGTRNCSLPNLTDVLNLTRLSLSVGSCYGGGVVYYLNNMPNASVGQRGLIAALQDTGSGSGQVWYVGSISDVGTSINLFTGRENTDLIIAEPDGSTSAAYLANTHTDGVYHDWYLPSSNELALLQIQSNADANLFTNCSGITPTTSNSYWSSSQYTAVGDQAWFMNMNGVIFPDNYSSAYLVRAIRAF